MDRYRIGGTIMNGSLRIFYDNITGERLVKVSRDEGMVIPTIDQDIATYTALSERNRDTFDVLEFPYGTYDQDFDLCISYRVSMETKTLKFSYPDPNEPGVEQPYVTPLSEQISSNNDYLLDVDYRLSMIELGL